LKKRIGGPGARGSKKDKEFRRNRAIWADAKSKAVEARKAYFAKIRAYRKRDEVVDAVLELVEILDGRRKRRSKKDRKKFRQMFRSWFNAWMAAKKEAAGLKKRIGGPGARGSKKDKEFRRNRAIWADAKSKAVEARKAYFAKIRAYRKR